MKYDPPETGLPIVESVCGNGHKWAGELAWLLPMVFPENLPLKGACPTCLADLHIEAGSYEPDEQGIYRRTGDVDPSVVEEIVTTDT